MNCRAVIQAGIFLFRQAEDSKESFQNLFSAIFASQQQVLFFFSLVIYFISTRPTHSANNKTGLNAG